MTLTRLKPFGARRKTYFYGVAGFVLAAHVVVGAIFHVMPPEFDEPGTIVPVEVQIIDHLLPDDVVESSAVRMVEDPAPEEEEAPVFVPVWEPSPVAPEPEPLGPTETVLPEVVLDEGVSEPQAHDPAPPLVTEEPAPVSSSPPEPRKKPEPKPSAPPVKPKRPEPRKVESKPPAPRESVEPPAPAPAPEIERAIPVAPRTDARTGILNRLRNRSDSRPRNEPYEPASWSKRPPPYYPYEARKRGVEGTAHVRVSIDSSGRIVAARISKSSGDQLLDQAAMASVRKGVLNPARRGGRAVSSEMLVPFEFYLP